jgi:hypothetical protein
MNKALSIVVALAIVGIACQAVSRAQERGDAEAGMRRSQPPAADRQGRKYALTLRIQGTDKDDTFIVNDMEGVIITSPGMRVSVVGEGQLKGPETLDAPDARGPGSMKGYLRWTFDASGNNYYTGEFGDGADRYIRIDGPGNDRYEYDAGPGSDVITSTDGPGDDDYIYRNGFGNDQSAHVNNATQSSGNDVYWIDAGHGTDRIELLDGLGDDSYTYVNAEAIGFTDYYKGDKDVFSFVRDERQDEGR